MTGQEFASYVRYLTSTQSNTFTDDEIVLLANVVSRTMARKIANLDEGEFELPMTRDLVASTTFDDREYNIDFDVIRIKRIEAIPDGENWIRFNKFKHNALRKPTTESEVRYHFDNNEENAYYDVFRRSVWLFCGEVEAYEGGLKMWAQVYPEKIIETDLQSTNELSIPSEDNTFRLPAHFHEIWARLVARIHRMSKDKPLPLTEMEAAIKPDMDELLGDFANSSLEETPMQVVLPDDRRLQGW